MKFRQQDMAVKQANIRQKVLNIFAVGEDEDFEDGMISAFSAGLCKLIEKYGEVAIYEIGRLIRTVSSEIAGVALRVMGKLDDVKTYDCRLELLLKSLDSSAYLRDSAELGLESMSHG